MLIYITEVSLCWLVFLLIYKLLLSKETFFAINRTYLLGALVLGLFLPLISLPVGGTITNYSEPLAVTLQELELTVGIGSKTLETSTNNSFGSFSALLLGLYLTGMLYQLGIFLRGLLNIWHLRRSGEIEQWGNYRVVRTSKVHPPFSFYNALFLSKVVKLDPKDEQKIIIHEAAHIKRGHSLDVILLQVLSILFWFNPLVYLYRNALTDIHEYQADEAVLQHSSIKQYGKLLIEQSIQSLEVAFANHFIKSQLKKRINMMTKKRSLPLAYSKYFLALPMLLLAFLFVACEKTTEATEKEVSEALISAKTPTEKVYEEVDQMPVFPGCDEFVGNYEGQKECSNSKLLGYVYSNIKYPKAAKEAGIEGLGVVSFVVNTQGKVQNIEIKRDPGEGCGAEIQRIVESMNNLEESWRAGEQDGQKVNVKYNLPVRFALD